MTVQGISVLGSFQDLKHLCRQHAVEEVLITASRMSDARKAEICTQCAEISVPCRMFTLSLEPLIVQHPMVVDPENSHPFAVENVLD